MSETSASRATEHHPCPPGSDLGTGAEGATEHEEHNSLLTAPEKAELRAHEVVISDTDFVQAWVTHGQARTDAPTAFHETAALVLLATASDRNRWLDLQHKRIYPAVYCLNLADSGQRKSTPLEYAVTASQRAFKGRVLSNDYSAEALIDDLSSSSSRPVSRGTAFIDEAGRLLGTMRANHYGEGLKDLLSKLWDCPNEFSRKLKSGKTDLKEVFVNLIMATTRTRFADLVTPEDLASGFLARFLPNLVTESVQRRPLSLLSADIGKRAEDLAERLKHLHEELAEVPGTLALADEALGRIDRAEQDLEQWAGRQFNDHLVMPWARRLAEYVARLAIIFAISEGSDRVDRLQVLRAIRVVDRAKEHVRLLVDDLVADRQARDADKLLRFVVQNPGITRRELLRKTHWKVTKVDELATELKQRGQIKPSPTGDSYWPVTPLPVTLSPVTTVTSSPSEGARRVSFGDACDTVTCDSRVLSPKSSPEPPSGV